MLAPSLCMIGTKNNTLKWSLETSCAYWVRAAWARRPCWRCASAPSPPATTSTSTCCRVSSAKHKIIKWASYNIASTRWQHWDDLSKCPRLVCASRAVFTIDFVLTMRYLAKDVGVHGISILISDTYLWHVMKLMVQRLTARRFCFFISSSELRISWIRTSLFVLRTWK